MVNLKYACVILTTAFLLTACPKPAPLPDTKLFLTDALQRYDFTVTDANTELRVQFRRGGRHADGLNVGTPDKMAFDGNEMEAVNVVESGGEFLTQLVVSGFRRVFPTTPEGGMLSLTKGGTTYFHKIEVPAIRFAKFPGEFDRKKQIRLPITNADKIGRGIWTLKLKNSIWGNFGPIWIPGSTTSHDYPVGRTPADKVYFDVTSSDPAIVIDLPGFATAKGTSFYSVELSAIFPCNSEDEPAAAEKLTGLECTYSIPSVDIVFRGQTPVQGPGTPKTIPTVPPMLPANKAAKP